MLRRVVPSVRSTQIFKKGTIFNNKMRYYKSYVESIPMLRGLSTSCFYTGFFPILVTQKFLVLFLHAKIGILQFFSKTRLQKLRVQFFSIRIFFTTFHFDRSNDNDISSFLYIFVHRQHRLFKTNHIEQKEVLYLRK